MIILNNFLNNEKDFLKQMATVLYFNNKEEDKIKLKWCSVYFG